MVETNNHKFIVVVIIGAVVCVVTGYFIGVQYPGLVYEPAAPAWSAPDQMPPPPPTDLPPVPPEQENLDKFNQEITSWTTYRNEKYGFEVKYPTAWKIDVSDLRDGKGIDVSFNRGETDILRLVVFEGTIEADVLGRFGERPKTRHFVLNGIDMVGLPHGNYETEYELFFERNGYVYHFGESFFAQKGDGKIINTIVGSFKFVH